jgi:hypothetical protein
LKVVGVWMSRQPESCIAAKVLDVGWQVQQVQLFQYSMFLFLTKDGKFDLYYEPYITLITVLLSWCQIDIKS